jgi:hypothetical protein
MMRENRRATGKAGSNPLDAEAATALAVEALGFIASNPDLLSRFLAISGIRAADIRRAAQEPGFLAGVLHFLLAHEPTLMRFCGESGVDPAAVGHAARALPFGGDSPWTST